MAFASIGYGVSAILLNVLEFIFLVIGNKISAEEQFVETNMYYVITASILVLAGGLYFIDKNSAFVTFYTLGFTDRCSRRSFIPVPANNFNEAIKALK